MSLLFFGPASQGISTPGKTHSWRLYASCRGVGRRRDRWGIEESGHEEKLRMSKELEDEAEEGCIDSKLTVLTRNIGIAGGAGAYVRYFPTWQFEDC